MTPAQIEKLPKWAQAEIRHLISRAENAESENDQLRAGTFGEAGSNTYLQPYDDQPVLLPDGGLIEFRLGYNPDDRIQANVVDGVYLEIRGLDGLTVRPLTANSVAIELRE
jgi:hypothetical protein